MDAVNESKGKLNDINCEIYSYDDEEDLEEDELAELRLLRREKRDIV